MNFAFMSTRKFAIAMNIVRIISLIGVAFIIFYMVKNIEAVKILAYDPCKICMSKTGCNCYCFNPLG